MNASACRSPDCPVYRRSHCWLAAGFVLAALVVLEAPEVSAAGYEVGETTTRSLARGGTGVASTRDPSALYFNPALLPRADGLQVLTDVNAIDFNLEFQRADLVYQKNRQERRKEFDSVQHLGGPRPVPAAAVSWDLGVENLTAGLGIFTPSAYGEKCLGRRTDGDCQVDADSPARYLLVDSSLVEFYASAGLGYQFDLEHGSLSLGATGVYAYQNNDFTLAINSEPAPTSPYEEDPENDAIFRANNLTGHNVLGIFGIAYQTGGLRLAASYRPPMSWSSEGTADIDFPDSLANLDARLSDDSVTFRANQAGSLRFGVGYEDGTHPGISQRPRYEIEINGTWENWSAVEQFELIPHGDVLGPSGDDPIIRIDRIVQPWQWRDTFSLRLGGSWGALPWLTLHGGSMLETAAQPAAYTHPAFASWERYAGSLGASLHPWPWIDVKLAFMHVASPERSIDDGRIHQIVPGSRCKGPDYDDEACREPGRPPGNAQNEGDWSVHYNIASLGLTFRFE